MSADRARGGGRARARGRWIWVLIALLGLGTACGGSGGGSDDTGRDPDGQPPPAESRFWERLGINFHLDENSPVGDLTVQLDDLRSLGFRWLRTTAYWEPGVVERWEEFLEEAEDFDVLVVLNTLGPWDCTLDVVEDFFVPFVRRFDSSQIDGYEILNEFEVTGCSTERYLELYERALRELAPLTSKRIAPSSTRPMTQDFPRNLNVNQEIFRSGQVGEDAFLSMHMYGKQFEKFLFITPFLAREVEVPIWVTEFGAKPLEEQLAYLGTLTSFFEADLRPRRYYWYDYTEVEGYGLVRWGENGREESDLYRYLRDHALLPGRREPDGS